MKWHNIERITYNSPKNFNFKKDSFLKCNKKTKLREYRNTFAAPQAPQNFFNPYTLDILAFGALQKFRLSGGALKIPGRPGGGHPETPPSPFREGAWASLVSPKNEF